MQQLKLTNFKNYDLQTIQLSLGLNCFVGRNGMGKTNLLDAIYYLCMCKSNFNSSDLNSRKHGTEFFRLEGDFRLGEKKEQIVAKVAQRKKKVFERNGVAYDKLIEHIGLLPVVMIVPDDTELATGGSEIRRKLIDNTLSQLDRNYLNQLMRYNRLLKQRNAALKKMGQEKNFNDLLLRSYSSQMEEPALQIFEKRKAFLKAFSKTFNAYYQRISGKEETVDCRYSSQLEESTFADLHAERLEKDKILQRTTSGPHKDDLKLFIQDYPLKQFASQGQLKSFVLALKLAQFEFLRIEKKETPILLLDDIFDKLDAYRVRQLVELLMEQNFGQVCITDTHENRLKEVVKDLDENGKMFVVSHGLITEVEEPD